MLRNFFWRIHASVYDLKIDSHVHMDLQTLILENLSLNKNDILLDAGCGTGALELAIIRADKKVKRIVAIDNSEQMLKKAKTNLIGKELSINFVNTDLNKKLPLKESSLTKISCSNVLYNLRRPEITLKGFYNALKPDGILVFTEPKPNAQGKEIAKEHFRKLGFAGKIVASIKAILLILPFEVIINLIRKESAYFFEKEKIDKELKDIGFKKWEIKETYANQNWLVKAIK